MITGLKNGQRAYVLTGDDGIGRKVLDQIHNHAAYITAVRGHRNPSDGTPGAILQITEAIYSSYDGNRNAAGIVLIDEIEIHLPPKWQARIVMLLKSTFQNTTFYITTNSPIVLAQLNEGEAYRLERDADGVVNANMIHAPNRAAMVDVLQEAFGVDLNRIKQDSASPESQKAAKQQLLNLLKTQWGG